MEWSHEKELITFSVTAPTDGWIALGFTEGESIVGTNLIMMRVDNGLVYAEDQFVVGFGEHPTVESIGGKSQIFNLSGIEKKNETTVTFSITKKKEDAYHFDLFEGKELNIWLAWSVSDDFDHHSRERILRRVKL